MIEFVEGYNATLAYWKTYGVHEGKPRPPKKKHRISQTANTASGEWDISPSDVAKFKFTPNHPDGWSYSAIMAEIKKLKARKEYQIDQRQIAYLDSMMGMRMEQGYAESMAEARMLIETIERGSDGLPDYQTALTEAGFELQSRMCAFRTKPVEYESWKKTIKSGTFSLVIHDSEFDDVAYGDIHCIYSGHGVTHWHNMFRLDGDHRGHNDPTWRRYVFWPEAAKDLRRIAAAHLIDVIEKRLQRPKTRLSTPLGGAIPRD